MSSIIFLMSVLLMFLLALGVITLLARKSINNDTGRIGRIRRSYDAWERSRRMTSSKY